MADVQIDMLAAAREGAQRLGAHLADLTLELAAQRAVSEAQSQRIAEVEQRAAEAARRHAAELEEARVRVIELEQQLGGPAPALDDGDDAGDDDGTAD